jgi:hypothetical protein
MNEPAQDVAKMHAALDDAWSLRCGCIRGRRPKTIEAIWATRGAKCRCTWIMGGPEDTIGVFTGRSSADNQKLRAASHKT